ncbi:uncharacterized protein DS421_16g533260 [Arachis hypogaea]|nr:uncharacterized protein DS421_16g533260 [Arachis hypogaea]
MPFRSYNQLIIHFYSFHSNYINTNLYILYVNVNIATHNFYINMSNYASSYYCSCLMP